MTGAGLFKVTAQPVDVSDVVAALSNPSIGGVAAFVGLVRGSTEGRAVERLEYEAYAEMAESTLRQIGEEIQERWTSVNRVAIIHRVGKLAVGEVAVVVAVSAAHRNELFDALRYAIDRLKRITPIWKKEIWGEGAEWITEA